MKKIDFAISIAFLGAYLILLNFTGLDKTSAQESNTPYVIQNTSYSMQDPLPNHETHQVAIVAPPREDGKIYSGIVSYTSSQPVEVVILHKYEKNLNSSRSGGMLNASLANNEYVASVLKQFTEPIFNSGSFVFAGNALAFHNLEGKPFVVTYTIKGEISSLTNQ